MTRDEKVAILVQRWIPDSLRLSEDHDARLVSSAITAVIGAIYDSDRMTMQGQSSEVNEALSLWTDTIYAEHMAKEREHYASIEEKASRAMPVVNVESIDIEEPDLDRPEYKVASIVYTDTRKPGENRVVQARTIGEGMWETHLPGFRGLHKGSSPGEAFSKAVAASGAMVKGVT